VRGYADTATAGSVIRGRKIVQITMTMTEDPLSLWLLSALVMTTASGLDPYVWLAQETVIPDNLMNGVSE